MSIAPVFLYPAVRAAILTGGESLIAAYGPMLGGFIVNPADALDQGIAVQETLYLSLTGPATLQEDADTFAIQPGQLFLLPKDFDGEVWVNAASSGHRFSAVIIQPTSGFALPTGGFPPAGPTTVRKILKSFLYQEYNEDEDCQAFVDVFNDMGGDIVDWFVETGLPLYTSDAISGLLLNWTGEGIYGMPRPSLPSGRNRNIGPLNTWTPNTLMPNELKIIGNQNYYATTDDVYKRILTWHYYKGDGKYFTIRWLKRRIMRFLTGTNGGPGQVDDTSPVSVTFGVDNEVNINIPSGRRHVIGGALPNRFTLNSVKPNQLITSFEPLPQFPMAPILKSAIESGVLELPFQYTFTVNIL